MKNFQFFIVIFIHLFYTAQTYPPPPQKPTGYLPTPSSTNNHHQQPSSSHQSTPDYPFHNGYPDNTYPPAEHREGGSGSVAVQQGGDGVEIRCSIVRPAMSHSQRPDDHHRAPDRRPDDCHRDCGSSHRSDDYNRRPDDHNRRPDDHNRGHDDYNKRPDDYNRRPDEYSQMRHMREF